MYVRSNPVGGEVLVSLFPGQGVGHLLLWVCCVTCVREHWRPLPGVGEEVLGEVVGVGCFWVWVECSGLYTQVPDPRSYCPNAWLDDNEAVSLHDGIRGSLLQAGLHTSTQDANDKGVTGREGIIRV